jgi:hypothetical protein
MQITIRINLGAETHQVNTNLWVITQWERKFRRKASDLAQGIGVEDLAYLAYEACKTHNIIVPASFDDFIKKLHSIDVVSQESENPTEAAPTGDN